MNSVITQDFEEIISSNAAHHHIDAGYDRDRITLPLPPTQADETRFEMEVYARFMRHLRLVPGTRMDIKILSAIQFTADMMDHGDALVARILVDLGLRAPRRAFPVAFTDFIDKGAQRFAAGNGTPAPCAMALKQHWDRLGEDRFFSATPSAFDHLADGVRH